MVCQNVPMCSPPPPPPPQAMEVDQTLSTFPVLDETGSEQDISSVSSVSSKVSSNISKLSSDAGKPVWPCADCVQLNQMLSRNEYMHLICLYIRIFKLHVSHCLKLNLPTGMSFEIPTQDSSTIDLDDNSCYYSVWVSYAEIYNEFIYDLLGDAHVTGKTRSALKLQDDKNHNQFIRGELVYCT